MQSEQWEKIGKGVLIAATGAALTYLLEMIPGLELGEWTPVATAVLSVLVNVIRKLPL